MIEILKMSKIKMQSIFDNNPKTEIYIKKIKLFDNIDNIVVF